MDSTDREVQRLTTALIASEAKVHELEETVARCIRRGSRLRDALEYYSDVEGPAQDALALDPERPVQSPEKSR